MNKPVTPAASLALSAEMAVKASKIKTAFILALCAVLIGCTDEEHTSPQPAFSPSAVTDQAVSTFSWEGYTETPGAAQVIYQNGVPHTDKTGQFRDHYQEGISFFPIWMYGQKHPSTNFLCHPDELAKKWDERNPTDTGRVSNIAALKSGNFNTAQYWGLPEYSDTFLNESARQGLQTLFYWQPLDGAFSLELDFVTRHGNHANILGWIPTEETGRYFSKPEKTPEQWIQHFFSTRNQFKALSNRPVFILDNFWVVNQTELTVATDPSGALDAWLYWHQQDDVIATDNYILNLRTLTTFDQVNGLTRAGGFINRNYQSRRPYWSMLNVFEEYPDGTTMGAHQFPSPTQLRAMAYMSIIHGATGLAYFGSDDYALRKEKIIGIRPDTPAAYSRTGWCGSPEWADMLDVSSSKAQESIALWNQTTRINAEIQSLVPALLSPTSSRSYSVGVRGQAVSSTPIRTLLKFIDGNFYLFAVNLDNASIDTRFVLEGAINGRVDVAFESRSLQTKRNAGKVSFTDAFEPFAVHVYKFK